MSKKEYPAKLTTGYYRVREVWEDEASQLGAYRLLANARTAGCQCKWDAPESQRAGCTGKPDARCRGKAN